MDIIKSAFSAMVVGFIYGGAPAFLQAKRQFVERAQGDVFYSRLDAVVRSCGSRWPEPPASAFPTSSQ